ALHRGVRVGGLVRVVGTGGTGHSSRPWKPEQPVLPRVLDREAAESRATGGARPPRPRRGIPPPSRGASGIRTGQDARPRRIVAELPDLEARSLHGQPGEV